MDRKELIAWLAKDVAVADRKRAAWVTGKLNEVKRIHIVIQDVAGADVQVDIDDIRNVLPLDLYEAAVVEVNAERLARIVPLLDADGNWDAYGLGPYPAEIVVPFDWEPSEGLLLTDQDPDDYELADDEADVELPSPEEAAEVFEEASGEDIEDLLDDDDLGVELGEAPEGVELGPMPEADEED